MRLGGEREDVARLPAELLDRALGHELDMSRIVLRLAITRCHLHQSLSDVVTNAAAGQPAAEFLRLFQPLVYRLAVKPPVPTDLLTGNPPTPHQYARRLQNNQLPERRRLAEQKQSIRTR
jgi:hypothetical protein